MRTRWLPVAATAVDNSSLLLLSLYMGKLKGGGQGVEEMEVRLSSSRGVAKSRLLGRMADQGWVVGEGMVVVVNNLEEKVSLEVVDAQRDKVLGEVMVEVTEDRSDRDELGLKVRPIYYQTRP